MGCGSAFVASLIREHYKDRQEMQQPEYLPCWWAGYSSLARYSYRLVDALVVPKETPAQKIKQLAIGKVAQ